MTTPKGIFCGGDENILDCDCGGDYVTECIY